MPPQATTPAAPQDAAEQRVRSLQAELRITDAQMPQWSAFAQAMRDSAASTDRLFRQRAAQSMNALDNMKSYAQVARAYADTTEKLSASFEGVRLVVFEWGPTVSVTLLLALLSEP